MAAGCGSTGISPRPMLMGAAHDALWASNARVSLSCLCVLAHRLPHLLYGLVFLAPPLQGPRPAGLKRYPGAPADRLNTDRSYPSALYCAGGLPPGFLCQGAIRDAAWKGEHAAPGPGSVQVKIQDRDNQLCFQPTAQIFVHLGTGIAVRAIARPCRQRGDVAGVMPDYPAHRFGVSSDSGGDHRVRDQRCPRARRFSHPLHLPSAPSAADRLYACGY